MREEGVQKVFGTLDLFVSLLETEIKYPILQGGILPFWTPSFFYLTTRILLFFHNLFEYDVKSSFSFIYLCRFMIMWCYHKNGRKTT
ncbi:hypothetical protein DW936_00455 [Odoribacter splanchnicus]|nr:hypothetical protein DW936_00455 [Odoribacter splanchnicus]